MEIITTTIQKFKSFDNNPKKNNMKTNTKLLLLFLLFTCLTGFAQIKESGKLPKQTKMLQQKTLKQKVTFIELGSVRCIPCQKMQAVMKSIEKKYSKQVKVVFHDVWTDAGKPFGTQYGITAIPTQVFLDETGKEFFRHEGYFPEEELIKVLNTKGVQ